MEEILLGRPIFLVFRDHVKVELKLTDTSLRKIEDAFEGAVQARGAMVSIRLEGDMDLDAMEKKAFGHLTPAQRDRLYEIWLQKVGAMSILKPEFAKKLGASESQVEQARRIGQACVDEMMELMASGPDPAKAKEIDRLREAAEQKITSVLKAEQRKKLETLRGKPFKL